MRAFSLGNRAVIPRHLFKSHARWEQSGRHKARDSPALPGVLHHAALRRRLEKCQVPPDKPRLRFTDFGGLLLGEKLADLEKRGQTASGMPRLLAAVPRRRRLFDGPIRCGGGANLLGQAGTHLPQHCTEGPILEAT